MALSLKISNILTSSLRHRDLENSSDNSCRSLVAWPVNGNVDSFHSEIQNVQPSGDRRRDNLWSIVVSFSIVPDLKRSRQDRIEVHSWQMKWHGIMANGLIQRHWCYGSKLCNPNVSVLYKMAGAVQNDRCRPKPPLLYKMTGAIQSPRCCTR